MKMNKEINYGGPAFPSGESYTVNGNLNQKSPLHRGMTIRDYFAAQAMQSLLAGNIFGSGEYLKEMASHSYKVADAMIKQREESNE